MKASNYLSTLAFAIAAIAPLPFTPSSYAAEESGKGIARRDIVPDTTPRGAELEKSENVANPQKRPTRSSDGIKRDFSSINKARSPSRDVTPSETNVDRNAADNAPTGEREQRRER